MNVVDPPGSNGIIRTSSWVSLLAGLLLASIVTPVQAALDLRNASVEQLENGLTLILLEDRHFPVVSVQALYRVGARNEVTGKTGLAHFLEHMAFRDSRNFPDTELVSRIYAIGGEWHGYTWIDQTTYFSTAPKDNLDLLLRIEADRMSHLLLDENDMIAERGAVLAEMHMYENLPASMLIDAVNFTSFLAHPYRNNTIGWESDIENLQYRDVVDFYEQHYHPANAVIAIVGHFDSRDVRKRVKRLFGSMRRRPATPLPHTVEPPQSGERRIVLHGAAAERQFMIAYRAPSANSADFAAFLVLQEILGTGSGVNFLQNDWGTPVDDNAVFSGAADGLTTWYPPSAQDYVFIVGGFAPESSSERDVEQSIEGRISLVRRVAPSDAVLSEAIDDVLDALAFDVETTEDAAHQLAFFDGLGALDALLTLPARVASVTPADVQRVALTYLLPEQRSIAWHLPGASRPGPAAVPNAATDMMLQESPRAPRDDEVVAAPVFTTLSGRIPVIVQRSALSTTAQLQVVLASNRLAGTSADDPVPGYSSLSYSVRPEKMADAIVRARNAVAGLQIGTQADIEPSMDPATRLEQVFTEIIRVDGDPLVSPPGPQLIVVAGDVDVTGTTELIEAAFGEDAFEHREAGAAELFKAADRVINLGQPVAQAQLGYIVAAPGPRERLSDAWLLLLYILTHDYEGRLGKQAISESGLAYYIGSDYRSDGTNAWITLSTGVDPHKIKALKSLLSAELQRLLGEPPTMAEINEAKTHMLGRLESAAQSNAELATRLATHWLWYGEALTAESLRRRLDAISRQDVLDIVPLFIDGTTIVVAE